MAKNRLPCDKFNLNFIGSITGTSSSFSSPIPFHRDAKTMMMARSSSQRLLELPDLPMALSLMADLPDLISLFRGN